jgi:hypothetical protein
MIERQGQVRGVDGSDERAFPAKLGAQVQRKLAKLGGEIGMDEHHMHRKASFAC